MTSVDERDKSYSSSYVNSSTTKITELKRKSIRSGTVTILSQGITISIQLISTVVLARLLLPEDYGILAMVTAVTTFAGLFRDLGLSSAAIQKKHNSHPAKQLILA